MLRWRYLIAIAVAHPAAAQTTLTRAAQLFASTRWPAALSAYSSIADAARAAHDSAAEARAALGASWTTAALNDPLASRTWLARADSIAPLNDDAVRGAIHCARAILPETPLDSAEAITRQGIAQAERAGDARAGTFCLFRLALRYNWYGAPTHALSLFTEAIARARREHDLDLAATMLEWRGTVRLSTGDFQRSEADLANAITLGRQVNNVAAIGWSESELATLTRESGDDAAALRHLDRARAALTVLDNPQSLSYLRRVEGDVAMDIGDTTRARIALTAALTEAQRARVPADLAGIHMDLADLAVREHQWTTATAEMDSTRPFNTGTLYTHVAAWYSGIIALRRGDPAAARPLLQDALARLDTTQHVFQRYVREDLAETWLALGDTARAVQELANATTAVNAWRAALTDDELRTLAFQIEPDFGGPSPAPALVTAAAATSGRLDAAFTAAESRRARELADQLARATPHPVRSRVLALAEVQQSIPDDATAIIEYVTGPVGAPTTALTITRRAVRARVLLSADSLLNTIDRLDQLTSSGATTSAPARALGTAILTPAVDSLPSQITHLVIIPDGPLYRVPFSLLRVSDGHPAIDHWSLATAPSASILATLWQRPTEDRDARVLAFGDPSSGNLPWTSDEARLAASFANGSVVRLRDQATAAYLTHTPLDAYTVVHFATHAVIDDVVPAQSALLLTPTDSEGGRVGPGDLAALKLNADLVVLSACRTARGPIVAGEGVRGFTAPLLAAGARAIVATQWEVSDRATVPMMYDFYRALARGLPAADALRDAELMARRRGAPERQWAAFTVIGDPFAHTRLHLPPPNSIPTWLR